MLEKWRHHYTIWTTIFGVCNLTSDQGQSFAKSLYVFYKPMCIWRTSTSEIAAVHCWWIINQQDNYGLSQYFYLSSHGQNCPIFIEPSVMPHQNFGTLPSTIIISTTKSIFKKLLKTYRYLYKQAKKMLKTMCKQAKNCWKPCANRHMYSDCLTHFSAPASQWSSFPIFLICFH